MQTRSAREAQNESAKESGQRPTAHEATQHQGQPAPTTQAKRLPFVKLADSVFDVLSQQTTFVWRHMSVTPTLIEIGGNCRTQHGV
jgi:hypothetical protein